jgi:hypothetical protein
VGLLSKNAAQQIAGADQAIKGGWGIRLGLRLRF